MTIVCTWWGSCSLNGKQRPFLFPCSVMHVEHVPINDLLVCVSQGIAMKQMAFVSACRLPADVDLIGSDLISFI